VALVLGQEVCPVKQDKETETNWWIYRTQEDFRSTERKKGLFNNSSGTIDFPYKKWHSISPVQRAQKSIPNGLRP
jgi:hypothetical protein